MLFNFFKLLESDDYESYIEKCLYHYFHDLKSIHEVKNRLSMNFFTINDVIKILNANQNVKTYDSLTDSNNQEDVLYSFS